MSKKQKGIAVFLIAIVIITATVVTIIITRNKGEDIDKPFGGETSADITELERMFPEKKWKNQFTIEGSNGDSKTVKIDAEITVPKTDSMSAMEVEYLEPKTDNMKSLVEGIFDGGEIYYNDESRRTKEQWQNYIKNDIEYNIELYKSFIGMRDNDEDSNAFYESEIVKEEERRTAYEETMKKAPDEYTKVAQYDADSYVGYIDGEMYIFESTIDKSWHDDDIGYVGTQRRMASVYPCNKDEVYPDEIKGLDGVGHAPKDQAYEHAERIAGLGNQCSMSEDEARQFAKKYVEEIGGENYVISKCEEQYWWGFGGDEEVHTEYVVDGYVLEFELCIDNVLVNSFGKEDWYLSYLDHVSEIVDGPSSMESTIEVCIASKGLVSITVTNPLNVVNTTGNVKLLEMSSIYNIMIDEITDSGKYDGMADEKFNSMDLIYFRVRDKENKSHYTFIPVWRLCNKRGYDDYKYIMYEVLVNAIDGSIIDILEDSFQSTNVKEEP